MQEIMARSALLSFGYDTASAPMGRVTLEGWMAWRASSRSKSPKQAFSFRVNASLASAREKRRIVLPCPGQDQYVTLALSEV
jgi:hypothetical protein